MGGRQRKSFRSRFSDIAHLRSSNDIQMLHSIKDKALKKHYKKGRQNPSKIHRKINTLEAKMKPSWDETKDSKKRPNVILMMSDDQVINYHGV